MVTAAMLWQTYSIGGVAYSFGIANEVSWDVAMSQIDYEIFMYDMTIDGLPEENPKFHFFKEGIGGVKDEKNLWTRWKILSSATGMKITGT